MRWQPCGPTGRCATAPLSQLRSQNKVERASTTLTWDLRTSNNVIVVCLAGVAVEVNVLQGRRVKSPLVV